jgi:hypothetical protein
MTLRWRTLEKAVRQRVRAEIRASPALRREYKRVGKRPGRETDEWIWRGVLTVALAILVAAAANRGVPLAGQLGLVTCWCVGWTLYSASLLGEHLYSHDALVLAVLPVLPAEAFGEGWKRFCLGTWWTTVDVCVGFGVICALTHAGPPAWIAALLAVPLNWLGTLALAGGLRAYWPRAPYALGYQSLLCLLFGIAVGGERLAPFWIEVLDKLTPALDWVPPFGWINFAVRGVMVGQLSGLCVLPAVFGVLLLALRFAQSRLAAGYGLEELVADAWATPPWPEPPDEEAAPAETPDGIAPAPVGIALPAGGLLAGGDLARRGWLERLVFRWLTPRERTLAEFMSGGQLGWTRALWTGTACVALASLAGATLGRTGQAIFLVGLFIALNVAVPVLGSGFAAFSSVFHSGAHTPLYAGLPIGYSELSRLLLKVNLLRIAAFTPVALAAGWMSTWIFRPAVANGVELAFRLLVVLLCWQPTLAALRFSAGTNDTRRGFWRTLKLVALFIPLGLLIFGLGAACLFVPTLGWAALSALGTAVASLGVFVLYGWLYNRNVFDLMHGAPQ